MAAVWDTQAAGSMGRTGSPSGGWRVDNNLTDLKPPLVSV